MRPPFCYNIGKENRNGGITYETYNENNDPVPDDRRTAHRLRNTAGTYGKLAAKSCRKFGYDEGDRLDGYEYSRSR